MEKAKGEEMVTLEQESLLDEVLQATVERLDTMAEKYRGNILNPSLGHLQRAMAAAEAIERLDKAIDTRILGKILKLQGHKIGFVTDRDKNGGYDSGTVKRIVIAGLLRGVYPVNNEFNIIGGNLYITLEGYTRLVREIPGLTDFVAIPGVPHIGNGGALVPYYAEWRLDGKKDSLERFLRKLDDGSVLDQRIPIRVYEKERPTPDSILGKAKRKMLAAVYAQITGSYHSDEDSEAAIISERAETPQAKADRIAADLERRVEEIEQPGPSDEQHTNQVEN